MEKLFVSHKNLPKNILFLYILFSTINLAINISSESIIISELEKSYTQKYSINKDYCFDYSLQFDLSNSSNINSTILKNSYIHISLNSEKSKAQIIFSSTEQCPTISKAEKYSYKYSEKANFFMHYPNSDQFYITVKCLSYPCDFTLNSRVEKDYAKMDLSEVDSYSYFTTREEKIDKMAFKIPSSLNKIYPDGTKHLLTISVSNPSDLDYTQLYLINGNKKKNLNDNSYKTPMDLIFSFVEEKYKEPLSEDSFYVLEIESIEYQFVSISVKASIYNESSSKLYSEIIPNSISKYSYLNDSNNKIEEECFALNEKYLSDNVQDDDFLFASIEYFTDPIISYLKYNDKEQIPKEAKDLNQRTINFILEKKSNKYPSICFNNEKKISTFKLEVSHISKTNNNIDIYNPLSSGFFYTKILPKDNLALYTHNSDIHYTDKISFYIKVLKGNPKVYIMPSETYPDSYSTVSELIKDKNIIEPIFNKNEQVYLHTYNKGHQKDLSPFGPTQNLLYVHCPQDSPEQFCQYEVMIYSNFDEISLLANNTFYSSLSIDESDLYKIHIPKGNGEVKKIRVSLNTTEESEIITNEDDMKNLAMNIEVIGSIKICEFIPINNNDNEYDILFNVKAKKSFNYFIEYTLIVGEEDNTLSIHNLLFEKIKEIEIINSFPIKIIAELPFTKQNNKYNFKDLLFNCYFQSLNSKESDVINTFDEIEVNYTIINSNELNSIIETNKDENYLKSSLNKKFDKTTKSVILNINTDFLNKYQNNEKLIIYMSISSANNKKNINLSGKLFLFYKNNSDFIIPPDNYINDNLIVNGNCNYNLYHLKLENSEKNRYIVEFSSNYELNNEDLYISFLDFNNINNIKPENNLQNSTNINFVDSKIKLGSIHQFEFTLKDNSIKDIILCIVTKLKANKGGISSINYIFKYSTYSTIEYNNLKTYNFNGVIKNDTNNEKSISSLKFQSLKTKSNDSTDINVYGEISVRKILSSDRLNNEKLDTIAILESKYELIDGTVNRNKDTTTIAVPKIDTTKEYHSIIINSLIYNQKFVFNTIPEGVIENKTDKKGKDKINTLAVILICSGVIVVIIILIAIIMYCKSKGKNLKEDVMKTSFENSGVIDQLNEEKN